MSNFLPACWQRLGGEQREKEGREEGLPAWSLSHTQDVTHAVWGAGSALLRDFKVGLGLQEDVGVRAKEMQVLTAGKEGVFAGLKRAALLALGAL